MGTDNKCFYMPLFWNCSKMSKFLSAIFFISLAANVSIAGELTCEEILANSTSGLTCEDLAADSPTESVRMAVGKKISSSTIHADGSVEKVYPNGKHELFNSDGTPRGRNKVCSNSGGISVDCHYYGSNTWQEKP